MKKTISIIGVGRVGGALALALARKNYFVQNLVLRNNKTIDFLNTNINILNENELNKISTDIIFITTQDSEIENVAKKTFTMASPPPTAYQIQSMGSWK